MERAEQRSTLRRWKYDGQEKKGEMKCCDEDMLYGDTARRSGR
jgi:hypothetical protein